MASIQSFDSNTNNPSGNCAFCDSYYFCKREDVNGRCLDLCEECHYRFHCETCGFKKDIFDAHCKNCGELICNSCFDDIGTCDSCIKNVPEVFKKATAVLNRKSELDEKDEEERKRFNSTNSVENDEQYKKKKLLCSINTNPDGSITIEDRDGTRIQPTHNFYQGGGVNPGDVVSFTGPTADKLRIQHPYLTKDGQIEPLIRSKLLQIPEITGCCYDESSGKIHILLIKLPITTANVFEKIQIQIPDAEINDFSMILLH